MHRLKSLLFACVLSVFSLGAVLFLTELIVIAVDWIHDGKYVPVKSRTDFLRESSQDLERFRAERKSLNLRNAYVFPNAYLGYTFHSIPPHGDTRINRSGFNGPDFPLQKTPGVFTIVLSGGSVAMHFYTDGTAQSLENELNRHYTNEKINRFVVLSGALDGWRQPQEFMLLSQTAPFIDGFITLEGWNESRAVFQRQSRFFFELPDDIYYLAMAGHFGGATANLAYQLDAAVKKWQQERGWLQRSHLLYFISQRIRNLFRSWAVHGTISVNKAAQDYYQNTHLLPSVWTKEQRTDFIWNTYKKYLRSSYVVAKSMDVKTLFLIQPSPVYGKTLTPEELKVAGDLTYGDVYVQMEQKLLELRKEGVGVHSLLNIFEKHPETLYKDVIHLYPVGNEIVKQEMLRLIEQDWGFRRTK